MTTGASSNLWEKENPGDVVPKNEGSSGVFKDYYATVAGTLHGRPAFDDYPAALTGPKDG